MPRGTVFSGVLMAAALLTAGAEAADDLHMCIYENGDVAIEACNRAINSGRYRGVDLANAYSNRAAEMVAKKEYDRAISDSSVSIKLLPKGTLAYNNRGRAYQLKGDLSRALADFSVAISHDTENPSAYINRASVYEAQGDKAAAIKDLKRALASKPAKGKFVDVESDFKRAREYLARLLKS
jgi:tetratricopeptide (TPR) repeat protein